MDIRLHKNGKHIAVVAAGEMADEAYWRECLHSVDAIVCADGGYKHLKKLGIKPDLIVGDGDSQIPFPKNVKAHHFSPDKNLTDGEIAINSAKGMGADHVWFLGGLGGRVDHHACNQMLLTSFPDSLTLVDGHFAAQVTTKRLNVPCAQGDTISLFAADSSETRIRTQGLKFPLEDQLLQTASHGVSNLALESPVIVNVVSGKVLVFWLRKNHYSS